MIQWFQGDDTYHHERSWCPCFFRPRSLTFKMQLSISKPTALMAILYFEAFVFGFRQLLHNVTKTKHLVEGFQIILQHQLTVCISNV